MTFEIIWTSKSYEDIVSIYEYLVESSSEETANKIIDEIFWAPSQITYPSQFQYDEYRKDCRRIIIRNYKILYHICELNHNYLRGFLMLTVNRTSPEMME